MELPIETGEIDLYAWLMLGGSMSCLLNSQWWHPIALVALFLWYLRYAGLRVFTPEAQLCATPPMHLVAGVQCVGPYKKSRKVMADKQAVMARYHLELPHFRLFLDDPVATPPDQCRCIVGVVVEGREEQRKFRDRASNTRDLLESEIYGTELKGDSLLVSADLDREQKAREAAMARKNAQQKESESLTPAERRKRRRAAAAESERFSDPGEHRPWSRVRVPPILNFKFLEGSAKSFLSAWLVPRAAARAFSKLASVQNQSAGSDASTLRWPRIELEDRWWLGMGPGSIGPSITVMQPDGADDEKIWRKFGEELWHSLEVSQFGEKRKAKEDEGSEGGELKQEDIGETIHVQHT